MILECVEIRGVFVLTKLCAKASKIRGLGSCHFDALLPIYCLKFREFGFRVLKVVPGVVIRHFFYLIFFLKCMGGEVSRQNFVRVERVCAWWLYTPSGCVNKG